MYNVKHIMSFLGLFFLLFSPHILIFGVVIKTVYLFVVVPGIMGMLLYIYSHKRNIIERNMLLVMFIALVYFFLISGLNSFQDLSVIKEILMGFVILFACYYYAYRYYKIYRDRFVFRLFSDLNKAGVLHSVIVIATFLSPGFKLFLYSFISVTDKSMRYLFGEVLYERYQGIVPSGFSFLSTTHALLLVIGVWAFYMNDNKYKLGHIIIFWLGQLIIFASICLIGRTGLVVIIIFAIFLIILRIQEFIKDSRLSKKTFKLLVALLIILTPIVFTVPFSKYQKNIDYAFQTVINYSESRELDPSTTDVLQNHFIFPDNAFELLFGTGNFGRSDKLPCIPSDVGYVLFIYGAGIFGMLVGYSFYFIGLCYAYKYRRLNPYLFSFIAVYFLALIVLNLKDYYYISYAGYSQVFFIMMCMLGKCVEYRNNISVNISAPIGYARTC